jgi:hypothetical protein
MTQQMERQRVKELGMGSVWITSGHNLFLGTWLLVAPFFLGYGDIGAAMWNSVIIGALVLALASIRVWRPLRNKSLSWANVLLGVWLMAAPFVLGYSDIILAVGNDIFVGMGIVILSAWSAMSTPDTW